MATPGIVFEGRTILKPGAYGYGQPVSTLQFNAIALNVVAVVGTGLGGPPQTPFYFGITSVQAGLQLARGGDIWVAASCAWNPSPNLTTPGADKICFMRINKATQASVSLQNDVPENVVMVTDRDWGKHGNSGQIAILPGDNVLLRRVQLKKTVDSVNNLSPDLGQIMFMSYDGNGTATLIVDEFTNSTPFMTLAYHGNGIVATAAITDDGLGNRTLTTTVDPKVVGPDGSAGFTLALTNILYNSTDAVAAHINTLTGWTAVVDSGGAGEFSNFMAPFTQLAIGLSPHTINAVTDAGRELVVVVTPASVSPDGSKGFRIVLGAKGFETVQKIVNFINEQSYFNVQILASAGMAADWLDNYTVGPLTTDGVYLNGINGGIVDWIQTYAPAHTATLLLKGHAPVKEIGLTPLLGGSEGPPPTLTDWVHCFAKLSQEHVYFIVPCTEDLLVQSVALQHVLQSCDIKVKMRRQLYAGSALADLNFASPLQTNVTALANRIFRLNSSPASCFCPGIAVIDDQGNETMFPGWALAASAAGMKAGSPPQESLTFKYFSMLDIQGQIANSSEEAFITAGASYVKQVSDGFQMQIAQTTCLTDNRPFYSESSMIHVADTLLTDLELSLAKAYVGRPPEKLVLIRQQQIRADAEAIAQKYVDSGGLVAPDIHTPAYSFQLPIWLPDQRRWHLVGRAEIGVPGNYITINMGWTTTSVDSNGIAFTVGGQQLPS
jgi:hypothetical protein